MTEADVERIRAEERRLALWQAAGVADKMAADLIHDDDARGPFAKHWVSATFMAIGSQIRSLDTK